MGRVSSRISTPPFVADHRSVERIDGRQIDWANVSSTYVDAKSGKKVLPAGTVVGDLLGAGKLSPRVETTNPAIGLLVSTVAQDDRSAALSGVGLYVAGVVFAAMLPDANGSPRTLDGDVVDELAVNGARFKFVYYDDSRAVPPLGVPYARASLGFEFIPSQDFARRVTTSGHRFTIVGTPTLVDAADGDGIDFGVGDSLRFDGIEIADLLNRGPTGFTLYAIIPVVAGVTPNSLLQVTNNDTHWLFALGVETNGGGFAEVAYGVGYDDGHYEGSADYGNVARASENAVHVIAVRYERTHVVGAQESHANTPAELGRLTYYLDGVRVLADGYAPQDAVGLDADVDAGTFETPPDTIMILGDDGFQPIPYPRAGALRIFTDAHSPATIAQVSAWISAHNAIALP